MLSVVSGDRHLRRRPERHHGYPTGVSDDSLQWLAPPPELTDPVMVVMLAGWIDAGGAAYAAIEAITDETEASPVAQLDDDAYVDFRARRPIMELREGLNSVLQWERITLSVGSDRTGRDLIVLAGPEPDMAWHRFTRVIGEFAEQMGVRRMVHLGAYPFATPHTRAARLSVTTPSQDVLSQVPFLRSSIDVPAGIAASLEHDLHERGIASLGIWAQVPHYVAAMSYPAASVALLDGLREATGLVIDATSLRSEVMIQGQRLDGLIAGNEEHSLMITQLEQLYDASEDELPVDDGEPALEMASGDELAAELEAFLRDQD
jgi:hypothetical protein